MNKRYVSKLRGLLQVFIQCIFFIQRTLIQHPYINVNKMCRSTQLVLFSVMYSIVFLVLQRFSFFLFICKGHNLFCVQCMIIVPGCKIMAAFILMSHFLVILTIYGICTPFYCILDMLSVFVYA
jgi:hypothetical protein